LIALNESKLLYQGENSTGNSKERSIFSTLSVAEDGTKVYTPSPPTRTLLNRHTHAYTHTRTHTHAHTHTRTNTHSHPNLLALRQARPEVQSLLRLLPLPVVQPAWLLPACPPMRVDV